MPQAQLYDPQGNLIPEEQVHERFAAGEVRTAPDAELVLERAGTRIRVPAAEAAQYYREGYAIEAPTVTQYHDEREEYGDLPSQAGAFVEGAASGLTLGGTNYLARQIAPEYADDMARRREHNPVT